MSSETPVVFDDDNPEWSAADFARAKPGGELPSGLKAAFPNTGMHGLSPGSTKVPTTPS